MTVLEKIMSLPLLHGVNPERFSSIIEKTNLEFNTYMAGDEIIASGDRISSLLCLLSGRAQVDRQLFGGDIYVSEVADEGCFFGVDRMFGMNNKLGYSVRALTRCGTMEITKAQYLHLLAEDNIFLINCLNYLSRDVQKYGDMFASACIGSLHRLLADIVSVSTMRQSTGIIVKSKKTPLIDIFSTMVNSVQSELADLEDRGLVKIVSDYHWAIPDRSALIDSSCEACCES